MQTLSNILQTTLTTLLSVTNQEGEIVNLIEAVNVGTESAHLNLYLVIGSGLYPVWPLSLELKPGQKLEDTTIRYLPYGAQLKANANVADSIKVLTYIA
jgi:hypothetical protein